MFQHPVLPSPSLSGLGLSLGLNNLKGCHTSVTTSRARLTETKTTT